jgi:hypothetical protein
MPFPNKRKRIALTSIIHHFCLVNEETRADIATKADLGSNGRKDLDNFLQAAAQNGSDKIFSYFKDLVTHGPYYNNAPTYIKQAIRTVYDLADEPDYDSASLQEIFNIIVDRQHNISDFYTGCWDVIRYSGRLPLGEESKDPYVIRAALEIYPPDSDGDKKSEFPTFRIHYKPLSQMGHPEFHKVNGCIVPLQGGNHMYFFGRELESDYPLDIIAIHSRERIPVFGGFVKRKQENGQILVSRARFIRSAEQNMEGLTSKIGTFPESELKKNFHDEIKNLDDVLKAVRNFVPDGGRGCLLL